MLFSNRGARLDGYVVHNRGKPENDQSTSTTFHHFLRYMRVSCRAGADGFHHEQFSVGPGGERNSLVGEFQALKLSIVRIGIPTMTHQQILRELPECTLSKINQNAVRDLVSVHHRS